MKKGIFILAIMILSNTVIAQQNDTISPISSCVEQLYLPNTFHSHGDCINDIFIPNIIGEPQEYSFLIYNRWGEIIFESYNIKDGWNGSIKGKSASSGTYVWMIEFSCPNDEKKYKFTGYVSLIK